VVANSGGMGTASASDVDSTVNAVGISGQPSGVTLGTFTPATGVGGTATIQILVDATVAAGTYPFSLNWANDQQQTATCSSTFTAGALTRIFTIQGSGSTSPLVGQSVITQGVVTRTTNTGFYMQDPTGDGDDTTSDGIFVFTSTAPPVNAGDLARVSGTVAEFNTGAATNTDTASHTVTELSSVSFVSVVGSGYSITPVVVNFPLTNRDDLEKYEGMLVTLNGPLTVAQNFYDGRFGQLTLAALGAVEQPTNRLRPGAAANALYADNKRRSIILEDGTTVQDPNPTPFLGADNTVRQGDTVPSITGVIDYGLATDANTDPGSWRIVPTVTPVFTRANPRTTAPDDVGGTIRIGSANIDNFFTTFTNGQTADGLTGQGCTVGNSTSASNCRGADSLAEFTRQRAKIVEELAGLNADVVAIMEVQNNGTTAVQNLVDALNARLGSVQYAAVPDAVQGTGTDAIKVAMIYKPAKLTRVGASVSDPNPIHNRAPLAQTFSVPGGQTFTLVANHLRAKGCSTTTGPDADQGDLQGCNNATRVQQVQATRSFVASLFPAGPLPPVIWVGDFNSYAMEDPIADMTANGYIDEIARFNTFGYSYQFDGASGRLDQVLTSPAMSGKIKRAFEWHINADEPSILDYNLEFKQPACPTCSPDYYTATPYRASDHDPILIGVTFPVVAPPKPGKGQ
jgi:predicted extracellular nuclease